MSFRFGLSNVWNPLLGWSGACGMSWSRAQSPRSFTEAEKPALPCWALAVRAWVLGWAEAIRCPLWGLDIKWGRSKHRKFLWRRPFSGPGARCAYGARFPGKQRPHLTFPSVRYWLRFLYLCLPKHSLVSSAFSSQIRECLQWFWEPFNIILMNVFSATFRQGPLSLFVTDNSNSFIYVCGLIAAY